MKEQIITRKDYMNDSSALHHRYYSQFVNGSTLQFVKDRIGMRKLKASKCEHLNDVAKHSRGGAGNWVWDYSPINMELAVKLGEVSAGYIPSDCTRTCVGKAAARMLLDA
jgi:hypothetical protein